MFISTGDIVAMRKPHPCGGYDWVITRTGADVKMRCTTCGHAVMLDRQVFDKRAKKIIGHTEENSGGEE